MLLRIIGEHKTTSFIMHFRVPGYRSRDAGSIPGATRFSEK
jgi:hypothetical protein